MAYAAFVEPDTILDHPATRAEQGQDQAIIERLSQYHAHLVSALGRLDDREAFRNAIVGAMRLLGYTAAEISQEFNCSRMTVHRWAQGEAAPFAGMRRVIFEKLQGKTRRRLRALTKAA
jgi:hypothetical protein